MKKEAQHHGITSISGSPVSAEYAKSIGADIYTKTAFDAAAAARKLLLERGDEA